MGEDGETHQGIYDIAYLGHIPEMTIMSPSNRTELCRMMNYAHQYEAPIAIRYPKGNLPEESEDAGPQIRFGQGYLVREEKDAFCLLLALGVCRKMAEEAAEQLAEKGIRVSVADARFVAPLSREWLLELSRQYPRILTIEDHIHTGGFGIKVRDLLAEESEESGANPGTSGSFYRAGQERSVAEPLWDQCGRNTESSGELECRSIKNGWICVW